MKRCPECGYRVKADELRDCPLCGVRMRNDPNGHTVKIETHVHEDEKCLLPNTGEDARERYKAVMEQQLRKASMSQKQPPMPKQLRQLVIGAVLVLIYALLASCTG